MIEAFNSKNENKLHALRLDSSGKLSRVTRFQSVQSKTNPGTNVSKKTPYGLAKYPMRTTYALVEMSPSNLSEAGLKKVKDRLAPDPGDQSNLLKGIPLEMWIKLEENTDLIDDCHSRHKYLHPLLKEGFAAKKLISCFPLVGRKLKGSMIVGTGI